jgi:hypothetical protein
MLDKEQLRQALYEAATKFVEEYNMNNNSMVTAFMKDDPEDPDDDDILIDGGSIHGVLYISVLED